MTFDAFQFYPTHDDLIQLMLEPLIEDKENRISGHKYKILHIGKNSNVIDPQAGTGNILDWIQANFYNYEKDHSGLKHLFACEIDMDRRYTLIGKSYNVVGSDWLEYNEPKLYGLVVMNPPFLTATKHILKSWEHVAEGGFLISLINTENLNNPCNSNRLKVLDLIDKYGYVDEHGIDHRREDLGNCFDISDNPEVIRKADVNVTVIRLKKPVSQNKVIDFNINQFSKDDINSDEFTANPIAVKNTIKSLVNQYNAATQALIERDEAQSKLSFYLNCGGNGEHINGVYSGDMLSLKSDLDTCLQAVKAKFWNAIFKRTEMEKRMPSNFKGKFEEFSSQQKNMAFNESNIMEVLNIFFFNQESIMIEAMLGVFDKIAKFDKKNCIGEGWKTNKSFKINNKIIYPGGVSYEDKFYPDWNPANKYHNQASFYEDLDKVLCYIGGYKYDSIISTMDAVSDRCSQLNKSRKSDVPEDYREEIESSFFYIKFFKKGTVHLKFRDAWLYEELNLRVARERKWISNETEYKHKKAPVKNVSIVRV